MLRSLSSSTPWNVSCEDGFTYVRPLIVPPFKANGGNMPVAIPTYQNRLFLIRNLLGALGCSSFFDCSDLVWNQLVM